MPRKILDQNLITYKKRIVYQTPQKAKSFWELLLAMIGLQVLATVLGFLTAGIGAGIIEGLGASQLFITTGKVFISGVTNFLVMETNDVINNNVSLKNTLLNLAFSFNDFGKLGRGLKAQKIIKIANEQGIFKQLGISAKVKNFMQIRNKVALSEIITKNKVVIRFNKTVTDEQLPQTIASIADAELRKQLKNLSADSIRDLLALQKTIYKLNPSLIPKYTNLDLKKYDSYLQKSAGISLKDFVRMNDYDSIAIITDLATKTKIGNTTLMKINQYRLENQFWNQLYKRFIKVKGKVNSSIKKTNPFYWIEKALNTVFEPIKKKITQLSEKVSQTITKSFKVDPKKLLYQSLITCQPDSFLLGFKFEPLGISGEGIIEIHKKDYISKKIGIVSKYHPIRAYTTLLEVEQFAVSQHQNTFYRENWQLGFGYSQNEFQLLSFLSPKIASIFQQNINFFNSIKSLYHVAKNFNVNNWGENQVNKMYKKIFNTNFNFLLGAIPGLKFFTPVIKNLIINHQYKNGQVVKILSSKVGSHLNRQYIRRI